MKNKLIHKSIEEYTFNINEYNINGIKSFNEFKKNYTSKKTGNFNGKYNLVKEKLLNLKDLLNIKYNQDIDPIEYIIYLYYGKKISIIDISNELKNIGINYPKSSLANLMNKTLDLELRDRLEITESKHNKDIINGNNNPFNKEKIQETKKAVDDILSNTQLINKGFKLKEYNSLKNITTKITYLLYNFGFIKENNLIYLENFIDKLYKGGLGTHRISHALETIINTSIILNNDLKISKINIDSKLVWEILKQKNS